MSDFGKFMDPLADKILVAAALLSLIELGVLPSWPALVILTREFIVSGIRMVAASKGTVIAASWYGKAKTVTQIIAIVLFIVKDSVVHIDPLEALYSPLYLVSWVVMIVALILTVISMLDYFVKARELLGFVPKGSSENNELSADPTTISARFDDEALYTKAKVVIETALERGVTIGCAESLTGGMISASLTAVPGSSQVVKGCIVSYVNEVKKDVLGVPCDVLDSQGAVNGDTAKTMAEGAVASLGCDIAVAVTGIAGPGGAEPGKPVGTVWMAVCRSGSSALATVSHYDGDRDNVRRQTVSAALDALLNAMEKQH